MENCSGCNEGLGTVLGEVCVQFIALLHRFDRTKGPVWGGEVGFCHRKWSLDPATLVLSGEINSMENCTGCNEGLAIVPGEVGVRFIALWSRFERTQGPVRGG